MSRRILAAIVWLLIATCGTWVCAQEPIPIATLERNDAVDFQKEILPIFRKNCLACHNATDAEGDLILETPQTILKGGGSGDVVQPGNGAESYLLQVSAHQEEPIMPPEDNESGAKPLTSMELALVKLWIDQGAKGEVKKQAEPLKWQPLAKSIRPILATAISRDRQFVACSRGNRLFVYHMPSGQLAQELTDPANELPVAHLDLVQSIAFHPHNQWMASGGFQTVKLWKRAEPVKTDWTLPGPVNTTVANDDWLFVGRTDGSINVVRNADGQLAKTLGGHTDLVICLAVSSDGSRLYSVSRDKTLRSWNVADGTQVAIVNLSSDSSSVTVSNDGKHVITGGSDNKIRVWQTPLPTDANAKPAREIAGHTGPISGLYANPAVADQFFSASNDGTVRAWQISDGQQLRQFDHGGDVRELVVSVDGKRLATGGTNSVTKLWNTADGKLIAELKGNPELSDRVARIGQQIQLTKAEVGSSNNAVNDSKKKLEERKKALEKARGEKDKAATDLEAKKKAVVDAKAEQQKLETSRDTLASTQADTKTIVEALAAKREATNKPVTELAQQVNAVREKSTQSGNEAVVAKIDELTALADALSKQQSDALENIKTKLNELTTLTQQKVEENKKQIEAATKKVTDGEKAVTDTDKKIQDAIARVAASEQDVTRAEGNVTSAESILNSLNAALAEYGAKQKAQQDGYQSSVKHIGALAFVGSRLVVGIHSGPVVLYDANTGEPGMVLDNSLSVQSINAIGPTKFVVAGGDGKAIAWEITPQWELATTIGGAASEGPLADRVMAMDFHPNGNLLATASGSPTRSGRIDFWNLEDGSLVRSIDEAHSDSIYGIEFSPSGDRIASASADRMVKVHDVETGEFVRSFEGHTHHVLDVAWQANEKRLISAGADKVLKLWDVSTGEQKRTISGIGKEATSVSFVGISQNAISTAGDSQIRLHNTGDGKTIRAMNGGGDFVYAADVSWDGKRAVSGGMKSVLQIWNTDDGKLLHAINAEN